MKKKALPLLLLSLVLALLLPLLGQAAALTATELDCRDPAQNGQHTLSLPPSTLLSCLLGTAIPDAERDYLDRITDLYLLYSDPVTHEAVQATLDEGGLLSVTMEGRRYTAENGISVLWVPTAATVGEQCVPLTQAVTQGAYTASLTGVAPGSILRVEYEVRIALPPALCEELLNLAFLAGQSDLSQLHDYEGRLAEHEAARTAYESYLDAKKVYDAAKEAFDDYLEDKAAYEADLAHWQDYQAAYEDFCAARDVYDAYLAELDVYEREYADYVTALGQALQDEQLFRDHLAYTAQLQECREKLAVMAYLLTPEYRFYSALTGDTVATVIANRHDLQQLGVSKEVLDSTAQETEQLRTLLDGYRACSGEEAKYRYLTENYAALSQSMGALYRALYALFSNSSVQIALDSLGKLDRYMQFVGQTYIAACLLDDDLAMSEEWTITCKLAYRKETATLEAALDGIAPIPEDKNSTDPRTLAYPDEVAGGLPAELPVQPTPPLPIKRPNEPTYVPEPTEPPIVNDPGDPPPVKNDPGEAPVCPVTDPYRTALARAVEEGALQWRADLPTSTLVISSSLQRALPSSTPTVSFYDEGGRQLLATVQAAPGGTVSYPGELPSKAPDREHLYSFLYFGDKSGGAADLSSVTEDTAVYACYQKTKRTEGSYTVSWIVGGTQVTEEYRYGETPQCPIPLERAPSDSTVYTFDGFSPLLAPVTGDVVYTATYRESVRSYTIVFHTGEGDIERSFPYGTTPTAPTVPDYYDATHLYRFRALSPALAPVTGAASYTALYDAEALVATEDGALPVVREDGRFLVSMSASEADLSCLLSLAIAEGRDLCLLTGKAQLLPASTGGSIAQSGRARLLIPVSAQRKMLQSGGVVCTLAAQTHDGYGVLSALTLSFSRKNGTEVSPPEGILLYFDYDGGEAAAEFADIRHVTDERETRLITSYAAGQLFCRPTKNGRFQLIELFPILKEIEGMGGVSISLNRVAAGEPITLTVLPAVGYALDSLVLTDAAGNEIALDGSYTFTMPRSSLTLKAAFVPRVYTVRFFSEGVLIDERQYFYGDTLTEPPAPEKSSSPDASYSFTGWSPTLIRTVTEDADYHASFRAVTPDTGGHTDTGGHLAPWLIALLVLLPILLIGGPLLLVILLRRKKKA